MRCIPSPQRGQREAAINGDFTPKGLVKALRWERCNLAARFFKLFSNHPLPSRRLAVLEKEAQERGHEFTFPQEQSPIGMRFLGVSLELLTRAAPWLGAYLGHLYCGVYDWPSNIPYFVVFGFTVGLVLSAILWYRPFHAYHSTTRELMLDLDVSDSNPRCGRIAGATVRATLLEPTYSSRTS
jgi:hypothetical protein